MAGYSGTSQAFEGMSNNKDEWSSPPSDGNGNTRNWESANRLVDLHHRVYHEATNHRTLQHENPDKPRWTGSDASRHRSTTRGPHTKAANDFRGIVDKSYPLMGPGNVDSQRRLLSTTEEYSQPHPTLLPRERDMTPSRYNGQPRLILQSEPTQSDNIVHVGTCQRPVQAKYQAASLGPAHRPQTQAEFRSSNQVSFSFETHDDYGRHDQQSQVHVTALQQRDCRLNASSNDPWTPGQFDAHPQYTTPTYNEECGIPFDFLGEPISASHLDPTRTPGRSYAGAQSPMLQGYLRNDLKQGRTRSSPSHSSFDAYSVPRDPKFLQPPPGSDTDTTSPSASSGISSTMPDVSVCEKCSKKYKGDYRKGNLARHKRQKHGPTVQTWACEEYGCEKLFKRQDARLKHYRKRHPRLVVGALLPRTY